MMHIPKYKKITTIKDLEDSGIDFSDELANSIASSISSQIDKEILAGVIGDALKNHTWQDPYKNQNIDETGQNCDLLPRFDLTLLVETAILPLKKKPQRSKPVMANKEQRYTWKNVELPARPSHKMANVNTRNEYWKKADGQSVRICDMANTHLINSICQIEKRLYAEWYSQGFSVMDSQRFRDTVGQHLVNTHRQYCALWTEVFRRRLEDKIQIDVTHLKWDMYPEIKHKPV